MYPHTVVTGEPMMSMYHFNFDTLHPVKHCVEQVLVFPQSGECSMDYVLTICRCSREFRLSVAYSLVDTS